ncbi:hypothetical protein D9Q98_001404 [Chlorella vulgaris]|uniref:Rho termination factor-like N-terminal domain-containing protein n=1 Tax=Chlorella vulgaris TaxID=3077 RepID=A0A9D4U028_CHLVU|nr:hypothetical protein D9Q98_001404 [Chlorella vulgaris]
MRASRAPVVRSRRAQPCCSLRQLVPAAVGAAFIGAVVAATLQSSKQQQDDLQARRQRRQHEGGPLQQLGNLLPTRPGFGLGWPLRSEEKRLLKTLHEIEKQQQRQASKDLKRWDARFALRTKPLAELRSLAQRQNIAGRSRMRKMELVAALEDAFGFVQRRPPPPTSL